MSKIKECLTLYICVELQKAMLTIKVLLFNWFVLLNR